MTRLLITGGSGFIGSHLALKLVTKGYEVTVLDNLSPQVHGNNPEGDSSLYNSIKREVQFILGSVTSTRDWLKALKKQDIVVHLAAETGTGQSMYSIKKYVDVNTWGTAILLDILANRPNSIKKIIVASSRAIYGEGKYSCESDGIVFPTERKDEDMIKGDFECKCPICGNKIKLLPTCENSKLHPTSVYGITKLNEEQMVVMIGKSLGIPTVSFRYQNVYGPGQSLSNPYTGILSIFSTQIRNKKTINVFEDGYESRDFVYIDDAVDATILGIENPMANNKVFNVGMGIPIDVITVAKTLKDELNEDIEIRITGNYRKGDIRHNLADLSHINNTLNFKPKIIFKEGISSFVQWVKTQGISQDNYQKSINELKAKGFYK